ncbi:hypothetical protein J6590_001612 [Homalodisca vitripennis]|nr:hypothetical protein J6590_001612 [Homalodisca vitripennis]
MVNGLPWGLTEWNPTNKKAYTSGNGIVIRALWCSGSILTRQVRDTGSRLESRRSKAGSKWPREQCVGIGLVSVVSTTDTHHRYYTQYAVPTLRVHFWLVYTFQLNHTWAQQKPMCNINLGNLMYVQERHITNRNVEILGCKDDCWSWWGSFRKSTILASLEVRVCPPLPASTGEECRCVSGPAERRNGPEADQDAWYSVMAGRNVYVLYMDLQMWLVIAVTACSL